LKRAADALKNLKIDPNSFLQQRELDDVVKTLEQTKSDNTLVCFQRVAEECIMDVSVEYTYPVVKAFFVDRP
jgi:hypothetical protein